VFPFQPPVLSGSGRYPYQKTLILPSGDRDEAEKAFRSGVQEQRAGRVTAAIRAYRQAVQADPSYFEALYNLGAMAYQAGDLNLSVYAYERALVAHPVSAAARYNFALALRRANYLEDAAAELERVLNVAPNDTQARLVLANLYAQQLNQPLLARQHYEKILSLDPSHPQSTEIRNWLAGFR
jgi:tetratricopeptide (TPR) repeat protein